MEPDEPFRSCRVYLITHDADATTISPGVYQSAVTWHVYTEDDLHVFDHFVFAIEDGLPCMRSGVSSTKTILARGWTFWN